MTYSIIGMLASVILFIINPDVLLWRAGRKLTLLQKQYRDFLLGVLSYYITDMLWGILDAHRLTGQEYADTAVHFVAMAAAVMLWTRFVVSYLGDRNRFGTILYSFGRIFLVFEVCVVVINFFHPILFWFDEAGQYHAGSARYITLVIQVLLFILTSVYTLYHSSRAAGAVRRRHLTIGLFGVIMMCFIAVQFFYPLLPFYAMGYLLGTCLLHSFVMEDEKEEYRRELEEAIEREQRQTVELMENRRALQDALATAKEASQAKTDFLSNMSHEIRTPMNAIISLNSIAMDDPTASDQVKEYLKKTDDSARHLLSIINDILDMSRIESGRMTIQSKEFSLTDSLQQVHAMIGDLCREKGIAYQYQAGEMDDYYVGDDMKLRQILLNILGNAVKFTPEGGTVRFTAEEVRRIEHKVMTRFTISDTGIGMDSEFLPHIFEIFSQEDSSSTNRYGSTGLGMPITKSMVELMGGTIEVESQKGRGTTFTVTVTLGEADHQNPEASADHPKEGPDADGAEAAAGDGSGRKKADLRGRRILLAEDVPVNAEIMMLLLSAKGIETDHAENGKIALQKFEDHEPGFYDAILMDMRMPEMDGLEATRRIRSTDRPDAETVPVIALTANAFDSDVEHSLQAGLNAHLTKPVEPDSLFRILEDLIR